MVKMMIKAKFY